jgi:16S rRNA processing protein RimM
VGIVAKAHGLRGEVAVDVLTDVPERFHPGSALLALLPSGARRPLKVEESRPFQERLLVRFEGIGSREQAEAIRGAELTVAREEVAPLPGGRYYRFELVGLRVATSRGVHLGTVAEVFATGSNDVLTVHGPRGEILIPVLQGVIVSVDLKGGALVVDPPPGLPGLDEA